MSIPGFTSDTSLYRRGRRYHVHCRYSDMKTNGVEPSVNWGSIGDYGCARPGVHKYAAILWNIPWGQSWEKTCAVTPGPPGTPVAGRSPDNCVNAGLNEWGEWYSRDPSCCVCVGCNTCSGTFSDLQTCLDACGSYNCPPAAGGYTCCDYNPCCYTSCG